MKTVNLFVGLLLALFVTVSCSSDDNTNNDNSLIIGVWSEYRHKVSNWNNEQWNIVAEPITLEFQSNGTLIDRYDGVVEAVGTWSISGNTLIENWEDETIQSDILILNQTTLQVKETFDDGEWLIYEYKKE